MANSSKVKKRERLDEHPSFAASSKMLQDFDEMLAALYPDVSRSNRIRQLIEEDINRNQAKLMRKKAGLL